MACTVTNPRTPDEKGPGHNVLLATRRGTRGPTLAEIREIPAGVWGSPRGLCAGEPDLSHPGRGLAWGDSSGSRDSQETHCRTLWMGLPTVQKKDPHDQFRNHPGKGPILCGGPIALAQGQPLCSRCP